MITLHLRYGGAGKGTIDEYPSSSNELLDRLESLRSEYTGLLGIPYGIDLIREGQGRLSVGLGESQWILSFYPENDSSVIYSLGNSDACGTELYYFGDRSQMSCKYLVPRRQAEEVTRAWFDDGVIDDAIKWTTQLC